MDDGQFVLLPSASPPPSAPPPSMLEEPPDELVPQPFAQAA
jgi:hypothetical protein